MISKEFIEQLEKARKKAKKIKTWHYTTAEKVFESKKHYKRKAKHKNQEILNKEAQYKDCAFLFSIKNIIFL